MAQSGKAREASPGFRKRSIRATGLAATFSAGIGFNPTYQNVVGFFARTIMRDLRLVGGQDILFGKIKTFIQDRLFEKSIDLEELNILRNLSEIAATRTIFETFKKAINDLTMVDRGTSQVRDRIKMSQSRPYAVKQQGYLLAKKIDLQQSCRRQRF